MSVQPAKWLASLCTGRAVCVNDIHTGYGAAKVGGLKSGEKVLNENLQIKDTLGPAGLSLVERSSSLGGPFSSVRK